MREQTANYILEILENRADCRYFETIDTVSGSKCTLGDANTNR